VQRFKDERFVDSVIASDRKRINAWYDEQSRKDKGLASTPWYSEKLNTADWSKMNIPGYWAQENDQPVNGVMWFRRDFNLPKSLVNKPAKIILGCIVDADSVFVNGRYVGNTTYQYPPRRYDIPAGVLKAGNNSVTARVISNWGRGGFVEDKFYGLEFDDNQTIDLSGAWLYKLGARMEPLQGETFFRWKPTGLYNGLLAPLFNYAIKGIVWYQGESNIGEGRSQEYKELFVTLINDWRKEWRQGDFPFLYVQLANFMQSYNHPTESHWAELRESQLKTLIVPNTGMAVAIDLGEWNDVHPLNKQDVGRRLALAARKIGYGEDNIVYSGPIYESMQIDGNKIILSFEHTGSGLVLKGGDKSYSFAIAGADDQFVWANAKIENNKVVVWSDDIAHPVAVRYAWADNPANAGLYNLEGLPASPFRIDVAEMK
jgi:sialate O-acetylesterase